MLTVLAALLAQDLSYPLLEKDPWAGFAVGSSVIRETRLPNRARWETTVQLKSADPQSKVLGVAHQGEEEQEQAVSFAPFSAPLQDVAGGYRLEAKATRPVARLKCFVREFAMEGAGVGNGVWKVATSDDVPGGLVEAAWSYEDETQKHSVSYLYKGPEKIKVQGKELACARFDLKEVQGLKSKKSIEGSYWLSAQVPGLFVRSVRRVTENKETSETTVQVLQFDAKK